jgi:hypothetical protein
MEYKKEPYASWENSTNTLSYFFYKTKDDSVSVSLKTEQYGTELMHSVDGAFSETIYLYEDVVKYVLSQSEIKVPSFLSLGLGMGYVEILLCAYLLKNNICNPVRIFSYEKEFELRDFFRKYIFNEEIPAVFKNAYDDIISKFTIYYKLDSDLKLAIQNKIKQNEIILNADYNMNTQLDYSINGLFFDAFSINTSPDLWEDSLLHKILSLCDTKAAFATYAARTHLKRVLLEHGFHLEKKKGYGGKKESTFAYR